MKTFLTFAILGALILLAIWKIGRDAAADEARPPNPELVCPHCKTKGQVVTKQVTRKKGISGGKAAGAILTAGLSLPATGLSRMEAEMEMKCRNCSTVWYV